jgi:glycosyltransferase involved in cell wall biosynthesis
MKASVVVPTFNQARYLAACLDSLWFQDHPDVEIVVVNDGSTDDTAGVLREYSLRVESDNVSYASFYDQETDRLERVHHPRYPSEGRTLTIITHPVNRGLAAALNTGFKACTGEACTYVPSDDWCMPGMLLELVRALEDTPADFAYADMLIVNDAFQVVRRFNLPDYNFQRCFADWYLCGDAKLYRRELYERHGFFDESLLAHDHDLFLRFALGGARFTHVPKALFAKRDHSGEREVHIHAPGNWKRLIGESKKLVLSARAHLKIQGEI